MENSAFNDFNGTSGEYSNVNNAQGGSNNMPVTTFYTENYKKPKKKRNNMLFQIVLVALISSIIGGGVVFTAFQFVAPAVKPSISGYLSGVISPRNTANTNQTDLPTVVKKIEIEQTDSPVTAIAEKVSPSIVGIRITAKVRDFFFGEREGTGEGSGIILSSDGYIITNYHVIRSVLSSGNTISKDAKIEVFLQSNIDKPYLAEIKGFDYRTDLAVLKIDAKGLPAAEFGDSDELKVGELAVAIGNPGGLELMGSVTAGIISGLDRTIKTEDGLEFKFIQTDAAINPGNSGGALVNSKGQVIGVNTLKTVAQGFEGLGFAIPINTVKEITDDLKEFNYVKGRPKLGIGVDVDFNEEAAKYYGVPAGVLVREVFPFTGAYKAGIKIGDIITEFDGNPVKTLEELNAIRDTHKPGDTVKAKIYRDGETLTLDVTLTEDDNKW